MVHHYLYLFTCMVVYHFVEILLQSLTELAKYKFIEIDEDGFTVRPLGTILSVDHTI